MQSELIDTLWNVNVYPKTEEKYLASELIDTLWNVNEAGGRIMTVEMWN